MFINDIEKMSDFLIMGAEYFLNSYNYLTQQEYSETRDYFHKNKIEVLSDMYRQAENMYIEELNDRPTYLSVSSETIKNKIIYYVEQYCTIPEQTEFYEVIDSMGC